MDQIDTILIEVEVVIYGVVVYEGDWRFDVRIEWDSIVDADYQLEPVAEVELFQDVISNEIKKIGLYFNPF